MPSSTRQPSSPKSPRNANYRSCSNNTTDDPLRTAVSGEVVDYRGFSTSIHELYADVDSERVDCCAMTCGGMLQSDRDRYLLTGVTPPAVLKRCTVHFLFPLAIFLTAGLCATHISDAALNQAISTILVLLLFGYFVLQCYKGHTKRIGIRKDLLWLKYQIHHHRRANLLELLEHERPEDVHDDVFLGQTRRDFGCAHPCCLIGCYPDDRRVGDEERRDDNFCSRLWTLACPNQACCGMHVQVCGVCAIAQEAREVENVLLPPAYRRIDYVTMQAVTDYYPAVYRARWEEPGSKWRPPLSRLSIRLLQALALLAGVLVLWAIGSPLYWTFVIGRKHHPRMFNGWDLMVFVLAWLQAAGLLAVIVYVVNRIKPSELSTDALIKYFASGFFLSTSLAVFWELVVSVLVRIIVSLILALSGIDTEMDPDQYNLSGFGTTFISPWLMTAGTSVKDFLQAFGNDHPIFYTFYILFNAFLVAALIEELCKYFGYRMVEHPDFFTKRDLDEASRIVFGENDDEDAEDAEGNLRRDGRPDYAKQQTSVQARGAAITLAMVAVAMGFTCCENLVYLFIYSNQSVQMELTVLVSRSFFPVHPLAAAIQSIGVCRRDLEASRETKIGRIILPAVLFHGAYDFFILWIDFMAKRNGVYADGDNDDAAFDAASAAAVISSLAISIALMAMAALYVYRQGGQQRERLADMDRQSTVDRSRLI